MSKQGMALFVGSYLKKILDRHQNTKLKIKFNLYLSDSCQRNIQKIVTWGIKSQKSKACFVHVSMGLLFSGVRPSKTLYLQRYHGFILL